MKKPLQVVLLVLALAFLSGCYSVVSTPASPASSISFDGNEQNGGVLAVREDGSFLVTSTFRGRYNALIARYGYQFVPEVLADSGVIPGDSGCWIMTSEAMANFIVMNQWLRMGRKQR